MPNLEAISLYVERGRHPTEGRVAPTRGWHWLGPGGGIVFLEVLRRVFAIFLTKEENGYSSSS